MKILTCTRMILVFSVFALFACAEVDDAELVGSAKDYIENNQVREASLELKNALQANPQNAEARYLLGQIHIMIGDMASAAKEFRKAQDAGWDEAQAQIGLMRALAGSREFVRLLDDIQIKETYPPQARADLYGLKAFAEAASGYDGLAKTSIRQGKAIDADAFQVLKTDIQLAISSGRAAEATELVKHALSLYENDTELLLLSAYAALKNNDSAGAVEQFTKIISLEPENLVTFNGKSARLGKARLAILDKDLQQAKDLLAPLLRMMPDEPEINYIGGLLSFEQAEFDLAEERLLKVLKVAPEHAKSQLLFGSINFAQKDYEQAAYYISKYLLKEPADLAARKLLGRTYILMGQHEQAQATLRPGLQSDDDAELLALVGLSQLQGGELAAGISDLEKAVLVAPDSNTLKGELAKAYISAGQTENAINQLNQILAEGGNRNQAEVLMVTAYLRVGQYDQAINVALDILQRSPQDASVLALVGGVFSSSGDKAEARKYFEQALAIAPDSIQATMLLAGLEEAEGYPEKAAALYEKAHASGAQSIDPLLALARLAEQQKDYQKMVSWLDESVKKAPLDIRPRQALAEHYLRNNQFDRADALVKEAMTAAPNEPALLLLKSRLLIAQSRHNEALLPLNELVTRVPKSVYVRTLLGETYLKLEQSSDARRQLKLALDEQPYYVPALLVLARVEQIAGNYELALDHVKQAQKAQPDLYLVYELTGDILMLTKHYQSAADAYRQAGTIRPDSETVIKQSEALMRLSETGQAIELLETWLNAHADDIRVRQFLGSAYLAKADNTGATREFAAVLDAQPDNIVALNNLAWLYSMKNDARALEYAEKAHKARPDDAGIQDTYGWVLVQQGQVEKGRQMLEQVMKTLSAIPEVQYHYAVALYKSGEQAEAKKRLQQLVDSGQPFEGIEDARKLLLQ